MTVEFISSQSPRLQDHLFDVWIRLRRDPTGSHYQSSDVAEAMLLEALEAPRQLSISEPLDRCAVPAHSPRWYRRYRIGTTAKPHQRRSGHRKTTREQLVIPELDYSLPQRIERIDREERQPI